MSPVTGWVLGPKADVNTKDFKGKDITLLESLFSKASCPETDSTEPKKQPRSKALLKKPNKIFHFLIDT